MQNQITSPLSNQHIEEVVIEELVYGGEGISHLANGKTVFVPNVIPGELVKIRTFEEKPKYCKAEYLDIIEPSADRIQPRCRHFGICGGCHLQHIPYQIQLQVKLKTITDQFTRIGKFSDPPVLPVDGSPLEWNYRNTVQFHVSPMGEIGYLEQKSLNLVPITECHLPQPPINSLWPQLEIDPSFKIDRVMIRNDSDNELIVGLDCSHNYIPEFSVDFPLSVVFLGKQNDFLLSGEPISYFSIRDAQFAVSPRSFFQVNLLQAERMVDYVLNSIAKESGSTVFDLYCGVGLFSRFLAPKFEQVVGIESSESACNDYSINLEPFENVSLYMGKVEDILDNLETKPDLILADPPRSGLARNVVEMLIHSPARRIIYVSCDPTTLARDARELSKGGFVLECIKPFDMFPQTFHIESVTVFSRK